MTDLNKVIDPNVTGTAADDAGRMDSMLNALKSGDAQALADMTTPTDTAVRSSDLIPDSDNPFDALFGEQDNEPSSDDSEMETQSSNEDDLPEGEVSDSADIEEIIVSDDKGRRRKVKVDFSNRDDIKKKLKLAHGARKWQRERDEARNQLKEASSWKEKSDFFDQLEQAYAKQGISGLVDRLEGRQGAYQEYEAKQRDKWERMQAMTPDELESYQKEEELEKYKREMESLRAEQEKFREEMESKQSKAHESEMMGKISPIFDRYRFSGKLGNSDQEEMLDQMVWDSALKKLQPYEDKGYDITSDLITRAFRSSANSIRKLVNVQTRKNTQKTLAKKKREATEHAQQAVQRGMTSGQRNDEARQMLESGNLAGFFKNFKGRIKM